MGYLNKVKGKNASRVVRSDKFWKGVDNVVNFFEPLVNVLRRMDSDVPSMGFLYSCLLDAKEEISDDHGRFQEVCDIIDKRWDNKLKTPLHRAGYYLNPYYYHHPKKLDIELDGLFREGLVSCVTKMVEDIEVQDQIIAELEHSHDANGTFGKEMAIRQRRNKKFDPGEYVVFMYISSILS